MKKIRGVSSTASLLPQILYEDDSLLVVNKPAGLVVNRSETVGRGETLQEWLEENFKFSILNFKLGEGEDGEEFRRRGGIVHRLDKDTSGVLVVAKTPPAFADLQRQFKERLVRKTYVALVHGKVAPSRGEIALPVGRDPKNRQRFAVLNSGRPAVTKYRVLEYYERHSGCRPESDSGVAEFTPPSAELPRMTCSGQDRACPGQSPGMTYTLLELQPLTGRTHQIRVHLAHLHHPVVADPWYAGRKTARADRSFCPRLFLHAQSLGFTHPRTGVWLKIEAELPEDLQKVLQQLHPTPSSC